jgi:hypothetical protein
MGTEVLEPASADRIPRFGPRVAGTPLPYPFGGGAIRSPRGSEPLLGGTIAAHFDGQLIAPDAAYDVVLRDQSAELARVRVSFGALR